MTRKKPEAPEPQPVRFEEALERLERIVEELEGKDLTLEDTLTRYEEGTRLVRECARRLEEAEQRIRTLTAEDVQAGSTPGEKRNGDTADEEGDPGEEDGEGDEDGDDDSDLPF